MCDPEKWAPVFGKDHAQTKRLDRYPARRCDGSHRRGDLRAGAACDRRVQARELGLDVVELLQGLAAAGGEALVQFGYAVVHGGRPLLFGVTAEILFCLPQRGCGAGAASRRTQQLYELGCRLSVSCITEAGRRARAARRNRRHLN